MPPALLYGTAWKEESTASAVREALDAGFRGVDTANQRRHYHEAGVGQAIAPFLSAHGRESLWIQSKFTYARGQDHRLPYDPAAKPAIQVRQSFASSLEHLGVSWLDSLLLHGPEARPGLTGTDWEVWRALEDLHEQGLVREIGVSNIDVDQLQLLLDRARIPPAYVQNRCYASRGWDAEVRGLCRAAGVTYQGFSLLTANRALWGHRDVAAIARRLGVTPAMVLLRFSMTQGILPITGTTDPNHMRQDLQVPDLTLSEDDVSTILARSAP